MKLNTDGKSQGAKILRTGCIIAALTMCFASSTQAADAKEWTIGYKENTNGPKEEKQGTNGWYFQYGNETNTDGKLDVSKLKECKWGTDGSCWFYYGYSGMWMPDAYLKKGYDCNKQGNWWRNDGNGKLDPNAGKEAVRGVISWKAPESGTYKVNMDYTAGSNSYEWEGKTYYSKDRDGVYLSLNTKKDILDKVHCESVTKKSPKLTKGNMKTEVELKKGESIYASVDPGKNGSNDEAKIKMKIQQTKVTKEKSFKAKSGVNSGVVLGIIAAAAILLGIGIVVMRGRKE